MAFSCKKDFIASCAVQDMDSQTKCKAVSKFQHTDMRPHNSFFRECSIFLECFPEFQANKPLRFGFVKKMVSPGMDLAIDFISLIS